MLFWNYNEQKEKLYGMSSGWTKNMQEERMMKRRMQLLLTVLACCFSLGMPSSPEKAMAAAPEDIAAVSAENGIQLLADEEPQKDGWVTLDNGKKKYFQDGQYLTGLQNIGEKTYYFNRYGVMAKDKWVRANNKKYRVNSQGWVIKNKVLTVDGNAYYLDETGAVYKGWKDFSKGRTYFLYTGIRAKGPTKIAGKYSYFTNAGYMATGTFTVNGVTYYMSDAGVMEKRRENSMYYDANNKALGAVESQNLETLETAKRIISQITTPGMSQSEKLYTCFRWVISKPYATRRPFSNFDGWPAVFANDHFIYGSGNCMSDGAAFAYLAYALGYDNVYVCSDSRGTDAHGWTEINGLAYDPLFAEAKSFSQNYAAPYGVYKLYPILHIKMHG